MTDPAYHAMQFMEYAEPRKVSSIWESDGMLPLSLKLCLRNTDTHVSHQFVPCCIGLCGRKTGERTLIEFEVQFGYVLYGEPREDYEGVFRI